MPHGGVHGPVQPFLADVAGEGRGQMHQVQDMPEGVPGGPRSGVRGYGERGCGGIGLHALRSMC